MGSNICDVRKKWLIVWLPTPSPAKWNSRYLKTKKYANMWHILRPPPARSALPCEHHKYIVPYMFAVIWIFLFQKKIRSCCFKDTSQNSKHCLKTLISHNIQSNWHNGWVYLLWNFTWQNATDVDSSTQKLYIYWYILICPKNLSMTLLPFEKCIFIRSCIFVFQGFFTVNNEHIQKCFLKSLCLHLLFHLLFWRLWKLFC